MHARGTIMRLTQTSRAHLARAALESIAYQTVDVGAISGIRIALQILNVDGTSANNFDAISD